MKYLKASVRPLSNISEGWKVSFIRFSSGRNFFFGETLSLRCLLHALI